MPEIPRIADPNRFTVAKRTLYFDAFMTRFIKIGGIGIIAAVFGIFIFILLQILPLFHNAKVEEQESYQTAVANGIMVGTDEWGEVPFILDQQGNFHFFPVKTDPVADEVQVEDIILQSGGREPVTVAAMEEDKDASIRSHYYFPKDGVVAMGFDDGEVLLRQVVYEPVFEEGNRTITFAVEDAGRYVMSPEGEPVTDVSLNRGDGYQMIGAIVGEGEASKAVVKVFSAKRSLFGTAELKLSDEFVFDDNPGSFPVRILVGGRGDRLFVIADDGIVSYYTYRKGELRFRQKFQPFEEGVRIANANWVLGRNSASFVSERGENIILSSYLDKEKGEIVYAQTKELPVFEGEVVDQNYSQRNRAYLIVGKSSASLRYMTTEVVRWASPNLGFDVVSGVIGPKYDSLVFLDGKGRIHFYGLDDPHPEAGMKAFFSKIWYEGQPKPDYSWQSTGGESSFEPKLSLVPLVFGSIKGTFYAMIFAVPISILAATYCSQFLRPEFRKVLKPSIEIMASLPSVVLGFLAALYLAPLFEDRVPSILVIFILVPFGCLAVGYLWGKLPQSLRVLIKPGWEFLALIPIILLFIWIGWHLGPLVERLLFVVQDPSTGERIADFRLWWPEFTGASYQQRNSLIIGFVLGFTVIPIIFTIAEDSMSNVPTALNSASLALGASRWQTAWRIVLPTASAGIFSGLMIGLGRAVGETMIVVMATGNTPVMDWNIFNGMRTLAANIAVELPEAPQHGTLYRTLFLGAMLLFILTFFVNTIAEIIRQRLRERYKTI